MYKYFKITLLIFCNILVSFTCTKNTNCHNIITVINASDKDIYITRNSSQWPDTSLHIGDYNPTLDGNNYKIKSHEQSNSTLQNRDCYENDFNNPLYDTMMVYVFDAQVLETTPWDTVTANNMYLKRYDLSLQDLQNSNWTITYP